MKRIAIVLIVLLSALTLAGCEETYTPDPAVEQYLNTGLTAEKAFDKLDGASYTTVETKQNKQGQILGKTVTEVAIDVADKNNMSMEMNVVYSGENVKDKIVSVRTDLRKTEGVYVYNTETSYSDKDKPVASAKEMDEKEATDLIRSVVYLDNGTYDEGGLYYGDYFLMIIYKYPTEFFYIDEDNLLVFDAKLYLVRDDIGDVKVLQKVKINDMGLIISESENWESVKEDLVITSETVPVYNFSQAN